jgi:hypothetical protein
MSGKLKNTIIMVVILVLLVVGGGAYNFIYQKAKINDRQKKIKALKLYQLDTDALNQQYALLNKRVAELDSVLANRRYNVPHILSQSNFFEFINKVNYKFSPYSYVNVEYNETETSNNFIVYIYTVNGVAEYNDLVELIYAIEESKQLKKIESIELSNNIKVDADAAPHYLISYKFKVRVFFSNDERFYVKDIKENMLSPNPSYDIFYPLIRNEIPPNKEKLLDVQTAQLLALIPDGAFFSDASGDTYLLWEGDKVYLGYLTNINYQNNEVYFVLNKGGLIENVTLKLVKEKKSK